MKYWQKKRNYRAWKNADGTFTFVITVDGQAVEVSPEVYKAYSQADRRERYQEKLDEDLLVSLQWVEANDMKLEFFTSRSSESAENAAVRNMMLRRMHVILPLLNSEEQKLIQCLYLRADAISIRKYARQKGLSDFGMRYRMKNVLSKIKKLMDFEK